MTRKGPPTGVERREAPRVSYTTDRDRAMLISVVVHATIILALIVVLPHLHRSVSFQAQAPIAITMLPSPAPVAEVAPSPQPDPAPPAAAPPPAVEESAPTLAPDPSFNPFALAPRAEIQESQPDAAAPPPPQPAPAQPQPSGGPVQAMDGEGNEYRGAQEAGAGAMAGDPTADAKLHPQYLRLQLHGYVSANYSNQLHMFLQRLIDCGVVPIASNNPALTVEADVYFTPQGMVQASQLTNQAVFGGDPAYHQAAAELMSALAKPGCTYMTLPPFYYQVWRTVHLSFFQRLPPGVLAH
jgi:hypothetical protein